ncbi:MAG: hypothetical protein JSS81_04100 [Acidobacteria bacterium]|nr:hypothetical protein [Acidobacteriota bacterium]
MKAFDRIRFLRVVVGLALLAGLFCSHELWFPVTREFPRAPLFFEPPAGFVVAFERALAVVLTGALAATIFFGRSRVFPALALGALLLFAVFDQTRLQPWVCQYALLLAVAAFGNPRRNDDDAAANRTLGLAQTVVAMLYFWSGAQKLNYSFAHELLPKLFENLFSTGNWPLGALALAIALTEMLIGVGLLVRRTRKLAVCAAIAMHLTILAALVAKDYNRVVWLWNAALIALVAGLFRQSGVSIAEAFRGPAKRSEKLLAGIVAAAVLLPVLSFFGLWDMYLSGALYSGNTEIAVIRIDDASFGKLPPKARSVVFRVQTTGERMLPLFEWALADLNVPAYPESRVSEQIARAVCRMTEDKASTELIVREKPGVFDGSWRLKRSGCPAPETP